MAKILIAGCGTIGTALGERLYAQHHEVTGLKRQPPPVGERKFDYLATDLGDASSLANLPDGFDRVVFIASANRGHPESYGRLYGDGVDNLIRVFSEMRNQPPWIFVSSTSVYAQNQGEWVDEGSPALGDSENSRWIAAAEHKILAANPASTVVRFSGIYGPGREYLLNLAAQAPRIQQHPPLYTNRIHEVDCVGVLEFLLKASLTGTPLANCYLASDNHPAPQWEVMQWLSNALGTNPPQAAAASAHASQNKRCSNRKLTELGYRLVYPDFRSGYGEIIQKKQQTESSTDLR